VHSEDDFFKVCFFVETMDYQYGIGGFERKKEKSELIFGGFRFRFFLRSPFSIFLGGP